jgi:hypothetical protein
MVNSTMNERRKKQKDEEKTKRQKEQMKLDRGRRRQGSEEKEEEEEEDDDDDDGVHWDELVHGGEDSSSQQTRPFPWHAQEQEREDAPRASKNRSFRLV